MIFLRWYFLTLGEDGGPLFDELVSLAFEEQSLFAFLLVFVERLGFTCSHYCLLSWCQGLDESWCFIYFGCDLLHVGIATLRGGFLCRYL